MHRAADPGATLRRLARLCEYIAAQDTADAVCRLVVRQTARLLGAQRTLLVLESHPRAIADARLPAEEDADFLLGAISPWLDEASLGRQACLRHIPEGVRVARQRSCAVAPLVAGGAVLGHLYADVDGSLGRFDAGHRDALATVAVHAATTLDGLRAREALRRWREQQAAFAGIAGTMSESAGDPARALDSVVAACRRTLHAPLAGLSLVGDDGRVHLGACLGPCEATIRAIFPLPLDERSVSGRCILQQRAIEYADLGHATDLPQGVRDAARAIGIRSLAFMPLVSQGRGLGALWVARRSAGALTPDRIGMLAILADQAVIALRSARLWQQAHQARAAAEASDDAGRRWLARLGREIRTTTSAVGGIGGQLLATRLDAAQRDLAAALARSGDALLETIDRIDDLSAIEAGRMTVERRPFDLRECVESALERAAASAADKRLDLACDFEGDVPAWVVGDAARLRQILLALLSNAVKFTAGGEVVVTLGYAADGTLQLRVRDTGIGLAADELHRLQACLDACQAPAEHGGGTVGLGLALGLRLAALMGGKVRAESAGPGRGSTFHLSVPAPRAAPAQTDRPEDRAEQPALAGRRVLVVDDNPTIRRIAAQQLSRWGLRVDDAQSPAQALAWLREGRRFDLAIVDFHMPGMDGIDLAQRLHEIDPGMAQVLCTPRGQPEPQGEAAGLFEATLAKPLRRSALYAAVESLLAARPAPGRCAGSGRLGSDPSLPELPADT